MKCMKLKIDQKQLSSFDEATDRFGVIKSLIDLYPQSQDLSVAFLGYSDLMHTADEWKNWTNGNLLALERRANADRLKAIHGRPDVDFVPTIQSALDAVFGNRVKATVFDFQTYEGTEIIHDFNKSISKKYHNKFDIVFDFGSLEHIFNIAEAISNLARIVKVQGLIFNENPLLMLNHGFYSFNPTFYYDFFAENGFDVKRARLTTKLTRTNPDGTKKAALINIKGLPEQDRFSLVQIENQLKIENVSKSEFVIGCLAQKIEKNDRIKFPVQGRYKEKNNWI